MGDNGLASPAKTPSEKSSCRSSHLAAEPPEQTLPEGPTYIEQAKFYTSLCLGTTAVLSVFAFLFLIPFVVDPAITTLMADYDPDPVTCVATHHAYNEGLTNCSWASCREGCTNAPTRCHQIFVNYTRVPFRLWGTNGTSLAAPVTWEMSSKRFLVNSAGCGYPPRVNCTEFARHYGAGSLGTPFPCYYSRTNPDSVVARYSWEDNLRHLVLSILVPNLLFVVSVGVLSYWYCPGCGRTCNKVYMETFPSREFVFS